MFDTQNFTRILHLVIPLDSWHHFNMPKALTIPRLCAWLAFERGCSAPAFHSTLFPRVVFNFFVFSLPGSESRAKLTSRIRSTALTIFIPQNPQYDFLCRFFRC
jgi:hypothetical protein